MPGDETGHGQARDPGTVGPVQPRNPGAAPSPTLAVYPGLRQSGWAVLAAGHGSERGYIEVMESGVAGNSDRRKMDPGLRIASQLRDLDAVVSRWSPSCLVCASPNGGNWGKQGLLQLDHALRLWARNLSLPLTVHAATDVRATVAGRSNASKDALAYAIMHLLGLIGQVRSSLEWEAIAAGWYHHRSLTSEHSTSTQRTAE